jgi:uncharacterized membrane protein YkgB
MLGILVGSLVVSVLVVTLAYWFASQMVNKERLGGFFYMSLIVMDIAIVFLACMAILYFNT